MIGNKYLSLPTKVVIRKLDNIMNYLKHFWILLLALSFATCNSGDDSYVIEDGEIIGTWELNGWCIDGDFTNYTRGSVTFLPDGTLKGRGYMNQLVGAYVCQGNNIKIDYGQTKIGYMHDEDSFFEENLKNVTRYAFTNKGHLILYFSGNDYFELTIKQ